MNDACNECLAGDHTNGDPAVDGGTGATACTPCDAGTYSADFATLCTACKTGTYSVRFYVGVKQFLLVFCGATSHGAYICPCRDATCCTGCVDVCLKAPRAQNMCTNCTVGQYANVPGLGSCLSCGAGYYNPVEGRALCTLCERGRAMPNLGQVDCATCDAGKRTAPYEPNSSLKRTPLLRCCCLVRRSVYYY